MRSAHGVTIVAAGGGRGCGPQEADAEADGKRALDAEAGAWMASERCAVSPRCTTVVVVVVVVVVERNFAVCTILGS
jgi:hypothetical protein